MTTPTPRVLDERFRARLESLLKRSHKYATSENPAQEYWQGSYAAFRLVAVDLGYSHAELNKILEGDGRG